MSLLDDFVEQNRAKKSSGHAAFDQPQGASLLPNGIDGNVGGGGYTPGVLGTNKAGIFWLDKVDFTISSRMLALQVSSDTLFIVFERGKLLRVNLQKADDIVEIEIPISKGEILDGNLKLYVDPTARHVIISTLRGTNYYHTSGWGKAKILGKLKDTYITAVAWNKSPKAVSGASNSTYPILLGTQSGDILETEFQPSQELFKNDIKYLQKLYELPQPEPVLGLNVEPFPADQRKYHVIMSTKTRLYQFVGFVDVFSGNDKALFKTLFAENSKMPNYQEIPGDESAGTLSVFSKHHEKGSLGASSTAAWLTSMGIYYGELVYGSQKAGDSVIKGAVLLPYPEDETSTPEVPISCVLTEFHIILLYPTRLKAVCVLNNVIIYEESISSPNSEPAQAILVDLIAQTYWVYSSAALFEIGISDEDRDIWRIYLQRNQFDLASKYAHDNEEKDIVLRAQANHCFASKQYKQSADYYAQSTMSFEETVLKFVHIKNNDALQRYLEVKLEALGTKDRMQISLIATWLIEINLAILNTFDAKISSAKNDISSNNDGSQSHILRNLEAEKKVSDDSFREFLSKYRKYTEKTVVYQLIKSHGRDDIMLYYADMLGEYHRIIDYWAKMGEYRKALEVLGKHVTPNYIYEYAIILIQHHPEELVDILMRQPDLEPRKLIPAFVKYEQKAVYNDRRNQAIRYLMFCVQEQKNTDPVVHNYLLTSLAKQGGVDAEHSLLTYLDSQGQSMVCNLDYALRVCRKYNRIQTCVYLYTKLGHHEDAVELALECNDLELAQISADKPKDRDLQRLLWLKIARHAINKEGDLKLARDIACSSKILEIEDILPYFPDFTQIDDFKEDICLALEDYEEEQQKLRIGMEESIQASQAIQSDMQDLRNRFTILAMDEVCQQCDQPLFLSQSSVFPCGHTFHTECLTLQVSMSSNRIQIKRIRELQTAIKELSRQQRKLKLLQAGTKSKHHELEELFAKLKKAREGLHEIVARECILCGEAMIKSVTEVFVDQDHDASEVSSWII
ncbi:tethering complex subunit [Mycoemilia scoparia]|uniref:Tethering complex subunit n=1 Tax=Mycoemilia scoparia TaxID=417184 RepID=A0A9W8A388_9FUNG|nr:tethering complex subunit [Mycoemilia scoparia]